MSTLPSRTFAFVAGVVILAICAITTSWSGPLHAEFWFWLGACLVGELLSVKLPVGEVSVSMASTFDFAALLVLPRGHAMAVAAISSLVAQRFFMRKPTIRAVFNGAQASLTVGAASWVLSRLGAVSHDPTDLLLRLQLLPLLAAAATYFVVNSGAVSLAVAVHERIPIPWAWRANFGSRYELLSNGALFSLGTLLASHYAVNGIAATALIVFPVLVAYYGYRHYARARMSELDRSEREAA